MDSGTAFTYIFKDPAWLKKVGIGGLLTLFSFLVIPIVFVLGYTVKTIKNVAAGEERPLPEWDDWGGFFTTGIKLAVVLLAYGIVVSIIGAILHFGFLRTLLNLVYYAFIPAIIMQYAKNEEIADGFKFPEMLALIQASASDYVIVLVLMLVAGFIGILGAIAVLIGAAFTFFYAQLVSANLYGQYIKLHGDQIPNGVASQPLS